MMGLTFFAILFLSLTGSIQSQAQVGELTPYTSFQGILLDINDDPVTVSTNVAFEIYNPAANCLLYRETQTVVPTSTGEISVLIGSNQGAAKRTAGTDPNLAWKTIFQNSDPITGSGACNYTPSPGDARKLRVYVGANAMSPDFSLAAVPMASVAQTLQGKQASDFLLANGGLNLYQGSLESIFAGPNYGKLTDLLAGTSSMYSRADGSNFSPGSNLNLNNNRITNLVSPTAGTDAVNKTYADTFIAGQASSNLGNLNMGHAGQAMVWNGTSWTTGTPSATDSTKLPLTGGTLSGALDMSSNSIGNVSQLGIGISTPHASAIVDMTSTTKGLLIPRMTEAARNAISSPAQGLQVYNTTTNQLNFWDGSSWQALGVAGSGISSFGGQTASVQSLSTGLAGTGPSWSSAAGIHTLNIPMASGVGVTAGLLSKTDYDSFVGKISSVAGSSLNSGLIWVGNGSNIAAPVSMSGHVTMTNLGATTIADGSISTSKIVDSSVTLSKLSGSLTLNSIVVTGASGLTTLPCAEGRFPQIVAGISNCSAVSLPTSAGTNGQVLVSNGSGTSSWAPAPWASMVDAFSVTSAMNGLSISGSAVRLHAADTTNPGGVSIGTQTFAGPKTFQDPLKVGTITGSNNPMLTVEGVATFRNNLAGSPITLRLTNQDSGTNSGSAMEFEGNSGAPKKLVRLAGLQEMPSTGTFSIETSPDGISYLSRLKVNSEGHVLVGHTGNPQARLEVRSNGAPVRLSRFISEMNTGTSSDVSIENYNNSPTAGPTLTFRGSQGNIMSPAPSMSGNPLGGIFFRGSEGAMASTSGANIKAVAAQNFTGGSNGTNLVFSTSSNNTSADTPRMTITHDGKVGIGTTNPVEVFSVFNGTTTGNYTMSGFTHSSDARLKKDVRNLEDSLQKILQLRGVSYVFKIDPNQKTQVGFIAQEAEKIFPEVVETDSKGFKSMVYSNLVAPLVEAVKTLYQRDNDLDARLQQLESKVESQNEMLKRLVSKVCAQNPHDEICL